MNPVPVMNLVEIVRGTFHFDETQANDRTAIGCAWKDAGNRQRFPGFVSNRVLMPMLNEAMYCVMEGVSSPESVDQIMKLGMNHPIGPLALADMIGLTYASTQWKF